MRSAFTLVELLVVVAIIVVLMAMLAPALDQAIYQADLARCSGNVKAMVNAGSIYALDHKRSYPSAARRERDTAQLLGAETGREAGWDLRPVFQQAALPWEKLLSCPLAPKIDLSFDANDEDTLVYAHYGIYFNWQYNDGRGVAGSAMSKLGSSFTVPDRPENRFRVLVADQFGENNINALAQSSHPDRDYRMSQVTFSNTVPPGDADQEIGPIAVGGSKRTHARWGTGGAIVRGLKDVNYGMDDGSVLRAAGIERFDDTLQRIPHRAQSVATPTSGFAIKVPQ